MLPLSQPIMTFLLFIKAKEVIAPGNCLLLICEGKGILMIEGRENIVILVNRTDYYAAIMRIFVKSAHCEWTIDAINN